MQRFMFTSEEQQYIIDHFPTMGAVEVAKCLGKTPQQIRTKLDSIERKTGTKPRLTTETKARLSREGKKPKPFHEFSVNPSQFMDVVTPEVAYLLGFLWADGYVSVKYLNGHERNWTVGLGIVYSDYADIKPVLESVGRWSVLTHRQEGRQPQARIRISNKPLGRFLKENDYGDKKVAPTKILSRIPDHLKHYWWRGYFDGDGCMSDGHLTITSCVDQDWVHATDLCSINGWAYRAMQQRDQWGSRSHFRFNGFGRDGFIHYIYQGKPMGLARKLERCKAFLAKRKGKSHI